MHFCTECKNMYYLKITDNNNLVYYCRNCGHEDTNLPNQTICVYESHIDNDAEHKLEHVVNKYTKYDLTLPRISNIHCPNPECVNNKNIDYLEGGGTPTKTSEKPSKKDTLLPVKSNIQNNMLDVVSIRYDDIAMKYAYMCTVCDTVWKTGNN